MMPPLGALCGAWVCSISILASAPVAQSIEYFTNTREVYPAGAGRNYFVVDTELWEHANPDLGDLRLYDTANREIPYALVTEEAISRSTENRATILDLGSRAGETSFILEMPPGEYNRVDLALEAKDFVGRAEVEGMDDLRGSHRTRLGSTPIFDFSRQGLGSSTVLKFPPSRFRYLRVTLRGGVPAESVKSAVVSLREEQRARWTEIPARVEERQQGRNSILDLSLPKTVPLQLVRFDVSQDQVNFRRPVSIFDSADRLLANGDISRVRLISHGEVIAEDGLELSFRPAHSVRYRIVIQNGDDLPVRLKTVRAFALERRVYFEDPDGRELRLYYGDSALSAPVYDYAKLFQEEPASAKASLGPGNHNRFYRPRPDRRPWSDRHPAVLWVALIAAIAILGLLAWRGLATPRSTSTAA